MASILELIDEAAVWLETKNADQWARPWPDRNARDERIRRGLTATKQRARQSYDLFHELAHSELPVKRSVYIRRLVSRSQVTTTFMPFRGLRGSNEHVCGLNSGSKSNCLFGPASTDFSLRHENEAAEPTTRDGRGLTAETFAAVFNLQPQNFMSLRVNQPYAAVLADAYRGVMLAAILVAFMVMRLMARVNILAASTVAVIATIMSHRHRHEPADGFLLKNNVNMDPWRVAVGP